LASTAPSILLIDERAGRSVALRLGMRITGTLGILDEAATRGLISLPEALALLTNTSFRYPRAIVDRLLKESGSTS